MRQVKQVYQTQVTQNRKKEIKVRVLLGGSWDEWSKGKVIL